MLSRIVRALFGSSLASVRRACKLLGRLVHNTQHLIVGNRLGGRGGRNLRLLFRLQALHNMHIPVGCNTDYLPPTHDDSKLA